MDAISFQDETVVDTKWDCLNYGGEWVNQDINFDNTINSIMAMF